MIIARTPFSLSLGVVVGIKSGIEILSEADAPALTGLGSHGSFCGGLLRALHSYPQEEKSFQLLNLSAILRVR
jgi:galactokinase/mevalonate kinase-like predicted kinase